MAPCPSPSWHWHAGASGPALTRLLLRFMLVIAFIDLHRSVPRCVLAMSEPPPAGGPLRHLLANVAVLRVSPHGGTSPCLGVRVGPTEIVASARCLVQHLAAHGHATAPSNTSSSSNTSLVTWTAGFFDGSERSAATQKLGDEAGVVVGPVAAEEVRVLAVTYHPQFDRTRALMATGDEANERRTSGSSSRSNTDLAVLRLERRPRGLSTTTSMKIKSGSVIPVAFSYSSSYHIVAIDPRTMGTEVVSSTVFIPHGQCGLPRATPHTRNVTSCVAPAAPEERGGFRSPNPWTLLVYSSSSSANFRLVGLGTVSDAAGSTTASYVRAFTWTSPLKAEIPDIRERADVANDEEEAAEVRGGVPTSSSDDTGTVQAVKPCEGFIAGLRITKDGVNICGGSLIDRQFVLTAAHCLDGSDVAWVSIGTADTESTKRGEQIRVLRAIRHPKYNSKTKDFDIAILELMYPSIRTPVSVVSACPPPGTRAIVYGYGASSVTSTQLSATLQKVEVPIVASPMCAKALHNEILPSMICAGGERGRDACQGDSGGPLVFRPPPKGGSKTEFALVGIVSFGRGCGDKGVPGVYARVSRAREFILAHVPNVQWSGPADGAALETQTAVNSSRPLLPEAATPGVPKVSSASSVYTSTVVGGLLPPLVRETLAAFLLSGKTPDDAMAQALGHQVFAGRLDRTELVFSSTRPLTQLTGVLTAHSAKPLHQRKDRFARLSEWSQPRNVSDPVCAT